MKKFNFLSFLLGVIAIWGISVFALSSQYLKSDGTPDFQKLKSISNGNKLNAQMRDSLMDGLSILQQQSNSIPAGAIMAFNLSACPAGWTRFAEADGRFIMGSSSNSREKWGQSSIKLTIDQLPPHYFYIAGASNGHTNWIWDSKESYISDYVGNNVQWDANRSYRLAPTNTIPTAWRTNTLWSNTPVNIQNPYIKLLYCQKGEYAPPRQIGSCQGTYTIELPDENAACYRTRRHRSRSPESHSHTACAKKEEVKSEEDCKSKNLHWWKPVFSKRWDCAIKPAVTQITNNCNTIKNSQSCKQQSWCSREEREA